MKIGPPLAATCLVGLAIGFVLPVNEDAVAPVNLAPADKAGPAPGSEWADDVTLPRAGDGHFYAEVQLDAAPTLMLVDTGASMVALTEEDALAAGLYWDEADMATVARGASGPVRGVFVTLPQVSLGGIEARNVAAVVVPEGLPVSLLGQSFLSHVGKVAIEKDTMVLSQ